MGRPLLGPRYYASKGAWYATIGGVRHRLGEDEMLARQRYFELSLEAVKPPVQVGTVAEVVASYWAKLEGSNAPPNTITMARDRLTPFASIFGDRPAAGLTVAEVLHWLGQRKTWGQGTRRQLIGFLKAAYRYAKLPQTLERLERPATTCRNELCLITPEQHTSLLAAASPALVNVLVALEQTGARPGWVITVEAREVNGDEWRLRPMHGRKVRPKRGRKYLSVLLTPTAAELSARLAAVYPTGPIFRNWRGVPWDKDSLAKAVKYVRRKAGVSDTITAYSYRHSFGTRMAKVPGMTVLMLADLMSTSVSMIEQHYWHRDDTRMRELLLKGEV